MNFVFPERIRIARLPTPIQKLSRLSERYGGPEIYIKRDDLTGIAVSGNKVRKLEFTVAQALKEGCDVLITCGGLQSNHARATAAVAARLGLKSHLVLRGETPSVPSGNLFLDLLLGAEITYLPDAERDELDECMHRVASKYEQKGNNPFIIPLGASDATGALGYVAAVQEMIVQFQEMKFTPDAIIVAAGSAGTLTGLLIGKKLFGLSSRIVGINITADEAYFHQEVAKILEEFRECYKADINVENTDFQIIDGYVGAGYAQSRPEELHFIAQIAKTEGIILDPTYTGKAMYGLFQEINRGTFKKGDKLLFVHTGGIFGLFPVAAELSEEIKKI
jgi:D-cysteine desulfhydrase